MMQPLPRKTKYDAAFTAQNGTLISAAPGFDFVAKTVLPACHQCDAPRYFSGQERLLKDKRASLKNGWGSVAVTVQGKEYKLGLLLGEDGLTDNGTANVPAMLKKSGDMQSFQLNLYPWKKQPAAFTIQQAGKRTAAAGGVLQSHRNPEHRQKHLHL